MDEQRALRDLLPLAFALFALTNLMRIAPVPIHVPVSDVLGRVASGLAWHAQQIAENERDEAWTMFPGN